MKYRMTVEFSFPYEIRGSTVEFKEFVKDALETWGGQRHPDDWLFGSLSGVVIKNIKEKTNEKDHNTHIRRRTVRANP